MKIIKNEVQNRHLKQMYGRSMFFVSDESPTSLFENNQKKELLNATKISLERTSNLDEIKITVNEHGREGVKIINSLFKRSEEDFKNDNQILASYQEAISKRQTKEINCENFLLDIKSRFKNSVRYAYKKFYVDSNNNQKFNVYIFHIYTVIIATLAILNEIDFRPAIHIGINSDNALTLTIEMKSKRFRDENSKELSFPSGTEAKLLYLRTLCDQGDMEYTFEAINDRIVMKYVIFEASMVGERVFSMINEEDEFFERYMNLFNGKEIDIEEEE